MNTWMLPLSAILFGSTCFAHQETIAITLLPRVGQLESQLITMQSNQITHQANHNAEHITLNITIEGLKREIEQLKTRINVLEEKKEKL